MATPLGHGLAGLCGSQLATPVRHKYRWWWLLFALFAAVAPDMDFLPGLLVGDMNRFHHGWSHTVVGAVVFGALSALLLKRFTDTPARLGLWSGGIYASHLLLDWLTYDGRAPYGIPLFRPFTDAYFTSPVSVFGGVRHGVPGDSMGTVLGDIFSAHNLTVVGIELALMLPLLAAASWLGRRRRRPAGA